jgi:hypothetical protein
MRIHLPAAIDVLTAAGKDDNGGPLTTEHVFDTAR